VVSKWRWQLALAPGDRAKVGKKRLEVGRGYRLELELYGGFSSVLGNAFGPPKHAVSIAAAWGSERFTNGRLTFAAGVLLFCLTAQTPANAGICLTEHQEGENQCCETLYHAAK
jgi:hypothetical protein